MIIIQGLLPITIQFERPPALDVAHSTRSAIEKEHEVVIVEKRKGHSANNESVGVHKIMRVAKIVDVRIKKL